MTWRSFTTDGSCDLGFELYSNSDYCFKTILEYRIRDFNSIVDDISSYDHIGIMGAIEESLDGDDPLIVSDNRGAYFDGNSFI